MNILTKYTVLLLIVMPFFAQAAYYRWVDDKGEIHYSYSVPASKSQLGYDELSKNGMKMKQVLSSEKKREIRLLEIKRAKQKIIDDKKLKRKRIEEAEDSRLLYIFNNEEELIESYNAKLRLAQLTIDLLKSRHQFQSDKLGTLERRLERTGMTQQIDSLEKQITNIIDNLKIYQQAITENIVEKDKVQKDFEFTLKRYQRLTANLQKNVKK